MLVPPSLSDLDFLTTVDTVEMSKDKTRFLQSLVTCMPSRMLN